MQKIKISQIQADPLQPRQEFDVIYLKQLELSIAQHGVLQPIILEKVGVNKYLLVDGERRFRCAKKLGLKEMPAEVVKKMSELERLVKRFHIQEQHKNWSNFDKAIAIKYMLGTKEITGKELADLLGVTANTLNQLVLLLGLSKRNQTLATDKRIPFNVLGFIARTSVAVKDKVKNKKVENILVDMYLDDKLASLDFSDYTYAFKHGEDKLVNAFISKKGLSADEALAIAGFKEARGLTRFMSTVSWFVLTTKNAYKKNASKLLTKANVNMLESLIRELETFKKGAKLTE